VRPTHAPPTQPRAEGGDHRPVPDRAPRPRVGTVTIRPRGQRGPMRNARNERTAAAADGELGSMGQGRRQRLPCGSQSDRTHAAATRSDALRQRLVAENEDSQAHGAQRRRQPIEEPPRRRGDPEPRSERAMRGHPARLGSRNPTIWSKSVRLGLLPISGRTPSDTDGRARNRRTERFRVDLRPEDRSIRYESPDRPWSSPRLDATRAARNSGHQRSTQRYERRDCPCTRPDVPIECRLTRRLSLYPDRPGPVRLGKEYPSCSTPSGRPFPPPSVTN
jgi:hypothetical protein